MKDVFYKYPKGTKFEIDGSKRGPNFYVVRVFVPGEYPRQVEDFSSEREVLDWIKKHELA